MRARGRDQAARRWASVGASAFLVAAILGLGVAVAHLTAPGADAVDPLGEVLIESTFDDGGFDGWTRATSGRKGVDDDWGTVHTIPWTGGHVQVVQLDGTGGRNHPNSWIFKDIDVPQTAKTLTFDTEAHDRAGADAELRVRVVEGATSTILLDEVEHGCENCTDFHGRSIDISAYAGKTVTFYFEQNDNGDRGTFPGQNEQILLDNIRFRGPLPPCDLAGIVRDGNGEAGSDGHANPLAGVPVTLLQDGNPVAGPVVTESDGHYCIPGGLVDPGDYQLEVGLVDEKHDPSIFKTVHGANDDVVTTTMDVTGEDFGREDFDVSFAGTPAKPWLADVADIHWESTRFFDWLVGTLGIAPSRLVGLTIETGSTHHTSYQLKRVYISTVDTPYARRADAATVCPENCEWHEITHHLTDVLGIARTSDPACANRIVHGGWSNVTTCDSLGEGLPMFLPTFASLDIDAGRAGGYATDAYSVFGSLEANNFRPWSESSPGAYDEDTAVAQLLWDLADDAPDETSETYWDPVARGGDHAYTNRDGVALGGVALIHLLAAEKPATVADMYDGLLADPSVPAAVKTVDIDIDGDGTPDLSPLAEVFVLHGFRPVGHNVTDSFTLGGPVAVTPPGLQNKTERRDKAVTPGSAVRLQNPTGAPVTVGIDITYPSSSIHFDVVVAPSSERLVEVELPPYWGGTLPADGSLPPCAADDPWPVTLTLSASGVAPKSMSNCDFLHAIDAAKSDSVLTFSLAAAPVASAATTPPTPVPAVASGPSAPIVAIGAVILGAALVVFVLLRRRRPAPKG